MDVNMVLKKKLMVYLHAVKRVFYLYCHTWPLPRYHQIIHLEPRTAASSLVLPFSSTKLMGLRGLPSALSSSAGLSRTVDRDICTKRMLIMKPSPAEAAAYMKAAW